MSNKKRKDFIKELQKLDGASDREFGLPDIFEIFGQPSRVEINHKDGSPVLSFLYDDDLNSATEIKD